MKYNRILLKLSGEALLGKNSYGIDNDRLVVYAEEIKQIHDQGVEIAIVIGGGNIFRGLTGSEDGIDRVQADYMGMLATVINAVALKDALDKNGTQTRVQSAITMTAVAEPYIRLRAIRHLEKGRVVIFAAGTGNPYFTTDTAASLRAAEIEAQIVLKSTRVDGVYDKDPEKDSNAKFLNELSYKEVLDKKLSVMDLTAITLCEENSMPIRVFNGTVEGNIYKVLKGEEMGTFIK